MRSVTICGLGGIIAAAALASAPAQAVTQIGSGTVSLVDLFNPTVNLTTGTATFKATMGTTFQILGSGAFTATTGTMGKMNGIVQFSKIVGTTVAQTLTDFYVFPDGTPTGKYKFSVSSVTTQSYSVSPASNSIALYILGTTLDTTLGFSATPTGLTLSFNKTRGSDYSASATLAVPPTTSVPEPSTWALGVIGFGALGFMMRRRARTSLTFG